ncbi:MAG: response regulator [Bacilli bacterium]|nr:response regulator [Bacilli bacterium]
MKGTIFLTVSALIYTVATTFIFFKKDTINKLENRIFKKLLIATICGMFFELLIIPFAEVPIFSTLIPRFFFVCLIIWLMIFFMYTFAVTTFKEDVPEEENIKKYKVSHIVFMIINLVLCILVYTLPMEFVSVGDSKYITGPATNVLFATNGVYVTLMSILVLTHFKKVHKKGYIPIIALIILLLLVGVIQSSHPEMLLANGVFGFIIYLMYHTIENPDLKMLRQMEIAKNQAERANNAKSDFLSSMSHEIRTPLNAIVGFSEDIQSHKDTCDPEIVEDADYIMEASKTLLEIVGNILDINKIESNKMEITEVKYNFKEEIEQLGKIDATRIGEKNINFKMNLAPDIPYELIGDKTHIKEIVNNLLTNAIKYTEQGEVELNAKCINRNNICNLIISVRDTGKGIKAENINKLFTKFERLDAEKNSTTEGTGLGLAITKALVDMMGGKINVQSQFGKGSIFVVQIPQKISQMANPDQTVQINIAPIKQAMTQQPVEQPKVENIMPQPKIETPVQQPTVSVVTPTESVTSGYDGKKILIVDDNKLNIKVARRALEGFNFEIEECYDGQECLDKVVNGNEYDLILMDIMMPNMSGETAIAKLKEKPNFNIPTIALTADAVAGAREKYLSEGFVDYIAKPFNKDQIKEKLDLVFGGDSSSPVNQSEISNTEDEVVKAFSDMSKPIKEIDVPETAPKYDPTVDRFKDAEVHVIADNTNKNESNE